MDVHPINKRLNKVTKSYNPKGTYVQDVKYRWWEIDDREEVFNSIVAVVGSLSKTQQWRDLKHTRAYRMYSNTELWGGLQDALFYRGNATINLPTNRLVLNVIASTVDTAAAKIAQSRPRARFITTKGDFSLQRKAKLLTQYMDGIFEDMNLYEIQQAAFVDSAVMGTGITKFYYDESGVKVERVFPNELILGEADGIYAATRGKDAPRQIHQRRYVSKDVLIAQYPEFKQQITDAPNQLIDLQQGLTNNHTIVIESWHLKSGKDSNDGKHAITISNCTLVYEDYDKNHYPFVVQRWKPALLGFWGLGLGDELLALQLQINSLYRLIYQAMELMCNPRVVIDVQSQIALAHINDQIGAIIKYDGNPPNFVTPGAVAAEVYQHVERLEQKAYAMAGISQLSAQSIKPAGLDAAVAIREMQDIESDRYALVAQRYENSYLQAARMIIDLTRDYVDEYGDKAIQVKDKKFMKQIKWKEVSLDDNQFTLDVQASSRLPRTTAGRIATVQDLMQAGIIDQTYGRELLDFPDLDEYESLANAGLEDIKWVLEKIIDAGEYIAPEPTMDLQNLVKLAQSAYLRGQISGLEEDRMDLLRRLITDTHDLITMMNPPQSPGIQGGAPQASPTPTPQSPLLPNAPQTQ